MPEQSTADEAVIQLAALTATCNNLRTALKATERDVRTLMCHRTFQEVQRYVGQHGELKAHIMLAVRHIEDARMRLGKVCQYASDGISVYDKV